MSSEKTLLLLSLENLPFSLDWLPLNACLVGGAVRDALLNRQRDYTDLDFVLPEFAIETAKKIANYYQAGFVVLDAKRHIARVVFKQGTVDFAQQEGDSLEKDLKRRDFTVNAIAYNPHNGELIDPLHGLQDLKKGILRMISQENLKDDPLRLLRAYRQAAQLNFTIDSATREIIRQLAPLLKKIAAERVQSELGYLLANSQSSKWLKAAWEDGLLQLWLKQISLDKLESLARVDRAALSIREVINEDKFNQLIPDYSQSCCPEALQLVKLACLVSAIPEEAELELIRLKYSRTEIRTVTTALKYLPRLQEKALKMSLKEQYFFFLDVRNVFPVLAVLTVALGVNLEAIIPLINRYLNPHDQVAHPQPLVTGHDLIKHLNIFPSPIIGKLLTEIHIAYIEGKIFTAEEAIKFAASLI